MSATNFSVTFERFFLRIVDLGPIVYLNNFRTDAVALWANNLCVAVCVRLLAHCREQRLRCSAWGRIYVDRKTMAPRLLCASQYFSNLAKGRRLIASGVDLIPKLQFAFRSPFPANCTLWTVGFAVDKLSVVFIDARRIIQTAAICLF